MSIGCGELDHRESAPKVWSGVAERSGSEGHRTTVECRQAPNQNAAFYC